MSTRKVEIKGKIFEITETAKKIDSYKIGDPVKVMVKGYNDSYDVYNGMIIGFNDFEKQPAINVAYINMDYSSAEIRFATITDASDRYEIAPVGELELIRFKTEDAIDKMNRTIITKEHELADLIKKRDFFMENCGAFQV